VARFQRWQATRVVSAPGTVQVVRAYYYCRPCGHGHCPWETTLGLTSQALTPAATELTSLAGLLSSFAEASQKVLPKLAGVRVSESSVERTTETAGQHLGAALANGWLFGEARPWPWAVDAAGRRCAYVSVDATGVGQQGPHGASTDGRMANVGMVFNA
jgi:hypothetical protein